MESYTPKNFDDDKNPDKTGESSTSKKKKKKSGILPLPVEKETAKPTDESVATDKKPETTDEVSDNETGLELGDELQLPHVEQTTDESEFMGELIIDHTPEESETVIVPEEILEFEDPVAVDTLEEAAEQLSMTPSTTAEVFEPIPGQPESAPHISELLDVEPSHEPEDTMPGGASFGELFNPNQIETRVEDTARYQVPQMIPEADAQRRAYAAEKRGLSRGVVSGGLAGWWLGRRSGRRQAERQQRDVDYDRNKTVDRIQAQQTQLEQTVQQRETTLQRTIQRLRTSIDSRKRTEAYPIATPEHAQPSAPEKQVSVAVQEKTYTDFPKPLIEETPVTEDMFQAPNGHKFESSAWHRIEVDDKTGRLVERPSITYGEAFQQEQQQERLAREAAKSQAAVQVARTLSSPSQVITGGILPEPPAEFWQQQERTEDLPPVDATYIRQQLMQQTKSPVTWIVAVLILVLLLAFGAL